MGEVPRSSWRMTAKPRSRSFADGVGLRDVGVGECVGISLGDHRAARDVDHTRRFLTCTTCAAKSGRWRLISVVVTRNLWTI